MSQVGNFVLEITTSTGTGNLTLSSAESLTPPMTHIYAAGFAATFGTGSSNKFYYGIQHRDAHEREVGIGYMSDATTLVRETIIESTNSNNPVDFTAGTKYVTNDVPAQIQNQITRIGVAKMISIGATI